MQQAAAVASIVLVVVVVVVVVVLFVLVLMEVVVEEEAEVPAWLRQSMQWPSMATYLLDRVLKEMEKGEAEVVEARSGCYTLSLVLLLLPPFRPI